MRERWFISLRYEDGETAVWPKLFATQGDAVLMMQGWFCRRPDEVARFRIITVERALVR